jgi:hypothetical protein
MPYIGNQPQYTSFLTDTFSGNGSTTVFTMSVAPVNTAAVLVALSGVLQNPADYAVVGRILTFSSPPPSGVGNISIRYLALPASNVVSTAYRSVTEFTATAGQTTFAPASYTPGFIDVFRSGVRLSTSNYVATNGVTVTLNNPAAAGDLITVESFFVSSVLNAIPSVPGSITPALLDSTSQSGTGALQFPSGTTSQRPAGPALGMTRWNTTIGAMEVFIGNNTWQIIASTSYAVDALIVAGGGGGGLHSGGGGGAGGLLYYGSETPKAPNGSALQLTPGTSYAVVVGAGGAGSGGPYQSVTGNGFDGQNSSFAGNTAIGGGGGGSGGNGIAGRNGGSGGGGGRSIAAGVGTSGQGNTGGFPGTAQNPNYPGGGGGGAGAVGGAGNTGAGGTGGVGLQYSISGTATFYAGGGGGNLQDSANSVPTQGAGGLGGGGFATSSGLGTAGTANTGGGGGGANYNTGGGGAGGSGVVIIRYAGTVQRGTGGNVTISGGFVTHTFTSSGTYIA